MYMYTTCRLTEPWAIQHRATNLLMLDAQCQIKIEIQVSVRCEGFAPIFAIFVCKWIPQEKQGEQFSDNSEGCKRLLKAQVQFRFR